jgi:tungstate transport system substrate-binding protein
VSRLLPILALPALWLAAQVPIGPAQAASERFMVLASTTSTENSGLFAAVLPLFERRTGIQVRVVAVGTGQALRLAQRGDADVLLVHDTAAEERFVADGWGVERFDVMVNDFAMVGPRSDPAGIAGWTDAAKALAEIAASRSPFASRGDDSGTHKAELRLWKAANIDPTSASGTWYRETGSGMGATLNIAAGMEAYTLVDRGSWLSFANRRGLRLLVEGDQRLRNPYGVILVNPERHPHVRAEAGQAFIQWILSEEAQDAIGAFRVNGEPLFHPHARPR